MVKQEWLDLATIDPELEQAMKENPPPQLDSMPDDLPTLRTMLNNRKKAMTQAMSDPSAKAGVVETDTTIKSSDGYDIPVRIYKPEKPAPGGSPLIVFIHGGGFCLGSIEGEEMNCRNFVRRYNAVAVNPLYRLAPEYPFPYGAEDSWDVVKYCGQNAASLGADASKGFIVGGTSAGGNLAAVVGLRALREKLEPKITGLELLIPTFANHFEEAEAYKGKLRSLEQNKDAPILGQGAIRLFTKNYNPTPGDPNHDVLAQPKDNWSQLPPTLFQVCGMDPLRDEALLWEDELRERGVKTKLITYQGVPHGFWSMFPKMKASQKFVKDTEDGVGWLLEGGK